jgi:APA family basic amino acid/polyamine antiporter
VGLTLFYYRATAARVGDENREGGFRMPGYPLVPAFFVLAAIFAVVSTIWSNPRDAALGFVVIASGIPAFWWWRRHG